MPDPTVRELTRASKARQVAEEMLWQLKEAKAYDDPSDEHAMIGAVIDLLSARQTSLPASSPKALPEVELATYSLTQEQHFRRWVEIRNYVELLPSGERKHLDLFIQKTLGKQHDGDTDAIDIARSNPLALPQRAEQRSLGG